MKKTKKKNTGKILWILLAVVAAALVLELLLILFLEKKEDAPQLQETENKNNTAAVTPEAAEPSLSIEAGTVPAETESVSSADSTVPAAMEQEEPVPSTVPEETVEILEYVDNTIRTPYFTLYYPEAFADHLVVVNKSESPYTLEFYAMLENRPEQRIFDICLGADIQGNMGMVQTDAGEIRVNLTFYEFAPGEDWTEGEINTILAMQDAANDMIGELPLTQEQGSAPQPEIQETAPESSIVNVYSIRTPYCTLQYPVVWKDYLVTEQMEADADGVYRVRFYGKVAAHEQCLLFTLLFGGDEGNQLGAIMGDDDQFVTVNIQMEELELSGWAEEDAQILYSMQEAVNELISQLPLA